MSFPERPAAACRQAIDEYRGTNYFYVSPLFLRCVAGLPAPLGRSIYGGGGYEA